MPFHQSHNSRSNNNYNAYTYTDLTWYSHFHKNFEFILGLEGEALLNINGKEVPLSAGEGALILSNQIHSFRIEKGSRMWVAVFSEDFVPDFATFIKDKQGTQATFYLDRDVKELICEQLIKKESTTLIKKACFYAICDQYLKKISLEERKTKNDHMICRVLDYISEHHCEPLSLRQIAIEFGYEYHYLSRLLNQNYNVDFKRLLQEHRVDTARELMQSENAMNMTEIAMRSGFQSIRSFNDVFRELTGKTPSEYRGSLNKM